MAVTTSPVSTAPALAQPWYGLFSRGARDWLRHNQKVRDAVQALEEFIAQAHIAGAKVVLSGVQAQPQSMLERVHLGASSGKVFYAADFANAQSLALGLLESPKPLLH